MAEWRIEQSWFSPLTDDVIHLFLPLGTLRSDAKA